MIKNNKIDHRIVAEKVTYVIKKLSTILILS